MLSGETGAKIAHLSMKVFLPNWLKDWIGVILVDSQLKNQTLFILNCRGGHNVKQILSTERDQNNTVHSDAVPPFLVDLGTILYC